MSRNRVNTRGWWGILTAALVVTAAAVAVATAVAWAVVSPVAAGSLALAGGAVVVLSALTLLLIAVAWDRWREYALVIALGGFVLKIILMALALTVVPVPDWLDPVPAGIGALVAIVVWQTVEVLVFARTRRQIYDD